MANATAGRRAGLEKEHQILGVQNDPRPQFAYLGRVLKDLCAI